MSGCRLARTFLELFCLVEVAEGQAPAFPGGASLLQGGVVEALCGCQLTASQKNVVWHATWDRCGTCKPCACCCPRDRMVTRLLRCRGRGLACRGSVLPRALKKRLSEVALSHFRWPPIPLSAKADSPSERFYGGAAGGWTGMSPTVTEHVSRSRKGDTALAKAMQGCRSKGCSLDCPLRVFRSQSERERERDEANGVTDRTDLSLGTGRLPSSLPAMATARRTLRGRCAGGTP